MIDNAFAEMAAFEKVQDYVVRVNEQLQAKLLFTNARVEPPPSSSSSEEPPRRPPVPPIGTDVSSRRRRAFKYPPERRVRGKTSPPSQDLDLEELAQAADQAEEEENAMGTEDLAEEQPDMSADEEAARHFGHFDL